MKFKGPLGGKPRVTPAVMVANEIGCRTHWLVFLAVQSIHHHISNKQKNLYPSSFFAALLSHPCVVIGHNKRLEDLGLDFE